MVQCDARPRRTSARYDPGPKLRSIIEALRLPAGPDPRFATPAAISANLDEFTAAVHATWKDIQAEAIREIVRLEVLLVKTDLAKMPKGIADWLRYLCRVWRRVNDSVAWGLLGRRDMVRQLCRHRVRPTLIESNPQSVAMVLDDINKEPLSMAVWNDATTFLDVGDNNTARQKGKKELDFIELKQGNVNLAILELNRAMIRHRRAGEPEKAHEAIDAFHEKYGRSGFVQLMRVIKQFMGDFKVMEDVNDVLAKSANRDPDVDIEVTISEAVAESYDPELTQILRRADTDGTALGCIDGCLWVYVFHGEAVTRQQAIAEFSQRVFETSPETQAWLLEKTGKDILNPVGSVNQWAFVPTGLPIFLRLLEPDDIVELLYGRLMGRALLFFDWLRFEQVVQSTGCALTWVRPKPIDGKNLHEIIGRKTPRIGNRSGHGLRLGKMFVSQFFADGLRPASISAQCAEMLERTAAGAAS